MTDSSDQPLPAELPPLHLAPMRPLDGPPPDPRDHHWVYQCEVPGERVVVHVHGALSSVGLLPKVRIVTSDERDLSGLVPELDSLVDLTMAGPFSIDGILTSPVGGVNVAYRMAAIDPADAEIRARSAPLEFVIRDLIHLDGRRVGDLPYAARRFLLTSSIPAGPHWSIPTDYLDPAEALFAGEKIPFPIPHLLARRLDSRYFPGMSGRAWLRSAFRIMKVTPIVGWVDDRPGDQHHTDGLLVAGVPDADGVREVQEVRAGLSLTARARLAELLIQLPVSGTPPGLRYISSEGSASSVHRWARPGAVATVMGMSVTEDRRLGYPVLLGVDAAR